jgi:hypothetical protein
MSAATHRKRSVQGVSKLTPPSRADWWNAPVPGWPERLLIHNIVTDTETEIILRPVFDHDEEKTSARSPSAYRTCRVKPFEEGANHDED